MEFDCWTGLFIEGKRYTIVEKIRYREKTSDDTWTEYGLIADADDSGTAKELRTWLSIADGGLTCTRSVPISRRKPPTGYRLHDKGVQVVTGVWGDTDASVGDEAVYFQYESDDGKNTFFLEDWGSVKIAAQGQKIASSDIVPVDDSAAVRRAMQMRIQTEFLRYGENIGAYIFAVIGLFSIIYFVINIVPDVQEWHQFRRFLGVPYALHERLSDAPYYTRQADEGGAVMYTADVDAATAALDLIEGVDGWVQDAFADETNPERPIVIRTKEELAYITSDPDGAAHIVLCAAEPDTAPLEEQMKRSHTLARYAELVRAGDERGRAAVVLEKPASGPAPAAQSAPAAAGTAPVQTSDSKHYRKNH